MLPREAGSPWLTLACGIGLGVWTICAVVGALTIVRWALGG